MPESMRTDRRAEEDQQAGASMRARFPARLRHSPLPSVQGITSTLGVGLDEFIPFTCLHCGGIYLVQVVFIGLWLRRVGVAATVDDTPSSSLFFEIVIDTHGGKAVVGSEYSLLELGALVGQGEWLKWFAAGTEQWPSSSPQTCHGARPLQTL